MAWMLGMLENYYIAVASVLAYLACIVFWRK